VAFGSIFKGRVLGRKGHALNDFRRIGSCNDDLGCFCRRPINASAAAIAAGIAVANDRDGRQTTGHQPAAGSHNPVPPMHNSRGVGERAPALQQQILILP
jgi:hypothetical protein